MMIKKIKTKKIITTMVFILSIISITAFLILKESNKTTQDIDNLQITFPKDYVLTVNIPTKTNNVEIKEVRLESEYATIQIVRTKYDPNYRLQNVTGSLPTKKYISNVGMKLKEIGTLDNKKIFITKSGESNFYTVYTSEEKDKVTWENPLWLENQDYDKTLISYSIKESKETEKVRKEIHKIILSLKKLE